MLTLHLDKTVEQKLTELAALKNESIERIIAQAIELLCENEQQAEFNNLQFAQQHSLNALWNNEEDEIWNHVAEQGKFYIPIEEIQLPVYLDKSIADFFNKKCEFNSERLQFLINDLLRKDIEIAHRVGS